MQYIKEISYVNYIDISNSVEYYNVNDTENGAGQIVAWVEENDMTDEEGNIYYDLYIGSKYKMYFKNLYRYSTLVHDADLLLLFI